MSKTFLTFTSTNGFQYEYRHVNGMNVANMGSWVGDTDNNGEPISTNDKEFDDFIGLYLTDNEFYNMTDEELSSEYENF